MRHDNIRVPLHKPKIELDSVFLIQSLLQDPKYWAIVPKSVADQLRKRLGVTVQQLDPTAPDRTTCMMTHQFPRMGARDGIEILHSLVGQLGFFNQKNRTTTKRKKMKITHLKRREVQAPIVSSLIRAFANEIGYDRAVDIAKEVIRKDAILSGKTLAEEYSGNSMAELSKIAKEVWAKDDALEIKMVKENEKELSFDVSYCGYVEIYEKLGVKKLGCILSCIRDYYFLEGFNPKITLKRTKTIMEGGDYCNFRYVEE